MFILIDTYHFESIISKQKCIMIDSLPVRARYQRAFVDPLARLLAKTAIPPISITLCGCCLGLLAAPLLYLGYQEAALGVILCSGYLDTVDGALARQLNQTSPLGAVLDIVSDRLVESSIVVGLFLQAPQERAIATLLMMASVLVCVTSFLVVGIFEKNQSQKSFYYSPGIMERAEAFIFFTAMILLPAYFIYLSTAFTILVLFTALIRVVQFSKFRNV